MRNFTITRSAYEEYRYIHKLSWHVVNQSFSVSDNAGRKRETRAFLWPCVRASALLSLWLTCLFYLIASVMRFTILWSFLLRSILQILINENIDVIINVPIIMNMKAFLRNNATFIVLTSDDLSRRICCYFRINYLLFQNHY